MKKLLIFIMIMITYVNASNLFAGGETEAPTKSKRHCLIGGGLGLNSLSIKDSDNDSLVNIDIAIVSASAPATDKWGYTGFTSLSKSIFIMDNYGTDYSAMDIISFDNILGFGKSFKAKGMDWASMGMGVHIGTAKYSVNEYSLSILSVGPAFLITTGKVNGMGLVAEIHYDAVTTKNSIDDVFDSRFGYSLMWTYCY
ncbi:hypothetical protein KAS08_00370 [Candidatus Pacearchaeota archaeon]|nr:hypothetical protein [Candidatus Pacearchaeota archaeon]